MSTTTTAGARERASGEHRSGQAGPDAVRVCRVDTPRDSDLTVSPVRRGKNISEAVRPLFGEEGAKSPVDVLKIFPTERRFILRCPHDSYIRLLASLTEYDVQGEAVRVHGSPGVAESTVVHR